MRPGRVVSIRVSPKDCLSSIDIIEKLGLHIPGVSFAQVVSIAYSSMLESMRQNGVIPTRDGTEYNRMMLAFPIPLKAQRGRALDITRTFNLSSDNQVPAVAPNPDHKRKMLRYEELAYKRTSDSENMSSKESEELIALTNVLFPDIELQQQG